MRGSITQTGTAGQGQSGGGYWMNANHSGQLDRLGERTRTSFLDAIDRPVVTALIVLAGYICFVTLRWWIAASGNITEFVRAELPFAHSGRVPAGLHVFGSNGYDGQFYYRLALDPANLHRTAFGIRLDHPYRLERIGYPALAWLVSLGHYGLVPVALLLVNVLALFAIGLLGGMLAIDSGRHAMWGLLLAGYFGFFKSVGNDLAEPVAAACLLGGILAYRRAHPAVAGLLFGYGALTRETVIIVPLAIVLVRLTDAVLGGFRGRSRFRPSADDLAWCLPLAVFAGWQLVLRATTGRLIVLSGVDDNAHGGLPFTQFGNAMRKNVGLLGAHTYGASIWFAEVATLVLFVVAALVALRSTTVPAYERVAFVAFIVELGILSNTIWTGHADLRSLDECYLLAVLLLLRSKLRRIWPLASGAAITVVIAALHDVLYL
jgi:hypothetical protein